MDIRSGSILWETEDDGSVRFKSFLGNTEEELIDKGYAVKIKEDLIHVASDGKIKYLSFSDAYKKTESLIPFSAHQKKKDIWIWADPMRREFIATKGRYDFTFYHKAIKLFTKPEDIEETFSSFEKKYDEDDVSRYYFLVDEAASGRYTVTIGRKRDQIKTERKFSFFAGSLHEFVKKIEKCFELFYKELLSKDIYIREKEDKRESEELTKE